VPFLGVCFLFLCLWSFGRCCVICWCVICYRVLCLSALCCWVIGFVRCLLCLCSLLVWPFFVCDLLCCLWCCVFECWFMLRSYICVFSPGVMLFVFSFFSGVAFVWFGGCCLLLCSFMLWLSWVHVVVRSFVVCVTCCCVVCVYVHCCHLLFGGRRGVRPLFLCVLLLLSVLPGLLNSCFVVLVIDGVFGWGVCCRCLIRFCASRCCFLCWCVICCCDLGLGWYLLMC